MALKETPIIFSTEMVKAIIQDRKTTTRRKVKGIALKWLGSDLLFTPEYVADPGNNFCPFGQVGDMLWVRETFSPWKISQGDTTISSGYYYRANFPDGTGHKFKPSIFMPKEAARIWLEITHIKIERLNDISEDDALSEGVIEYEDGTFHNYFTQKGLRESDGVECLLAKGSFQGLWCSIHGLDSWKHNPWVWAISFRVLSRTGKPKQCNGSCGMNYCDENGCVERKRNLVEPSNITDQKTFPFSTLPKINLCKTSNNFPSRWSRCATRRCSTSNR